MLTTPNVLTEVSNLLAYTYEAMKLDLFTRLKTLTATMEERHIPATVSAERPEFTRLGLTDATLLDLAAAGIKIVTTDFDLYRSAVKINAKTINFRHLQERFS